MSDSPATPANGAAQPAPLVVNIQYIKDLSFEVPNAPAVFTTLRSAPRVDINLDVQARRITDGENVFEVVLAIRAHAVDPGETVQPGETAANVFLAELAYAGVFTLTNIPDTSMEPVLLVECPRILFPFARNILADVTRDGGFPPVLVQPIDFLALWQQRRPAPEGVA